MEIKDFIGRVVIQPTTRRRFLLSEITSPYIRIKSELPGENGYHSYSILNIISTDPITDGRLIFENPALTEPFKAAFGRHLHSKDSYWEDYGYWMRKD